MTLAAERLFVSGRMERIEHLVFHACYGRGVFST